MLSTTFSLFRMLYAAGTNITVADKLSRDFSTILDKMCQLKQKTQPPQTEFLHFKQNNSSKQVH